MQHHPTLYLEFAGDAADNANFFVRRILWNNFGRAAYTDTVGVANKDGVGHLDQDVVDAVDVRVADPAAMHVGEHPSRDKGLIQPAVAVGGAEKRAFGLKNEFSLKRERRDQALLEEEHVGRIQAKVRVRGEKVARGFKSCARRHDVPRDDDIALARFLAR